MRCIKGMLVCLFVVIVPLTNAFAQSWLCENTNLKRYVEIYYPNSPSYSPCSVIYRKPTEDAADRILWQAQNMEGYCKNKAKAFVEKLETWGWRCSINEPASKNKSVNSEPTNSSLSATALEKKLFNAVKLGNADNASSIRFDKYLEVIGDFNENNYINDDPNGHISKYHVYYLLNEQAHFMGHKVIVFTEPLEDAEREGCCPDKSFKIYLETVGTTEPLRNFAEANNCYFKDRYIWSFGGMYFHSGQYAVLDCQTN